MPLVAAKCTQCGANIQVNNEMEAAVCPFCNTPYIVEKAINNYSINLQGTVVVENAVIMNSNAENLAKRGEEFESAGAIEKAVDYYNKALDNDVNCARARSGIERIRKKEQNDVIFQLLNNAAEKEKHNINESLHIYKEILSLDPNNVTAKERLSGIYKEINDFDYYTSKAKSLKDSGEITLSFSTLSFVSKKGKKYDIPLDAISSIVAKENMRFSGESFGRTKPNTIFILQKDSSGIEAKYEYKVHNANELMCIVKALQKKDYQQAINISKSIK